VGVGHLAMAGGHSTTGVGHLVIAGGHLTTGVGHLATRGIPGMIVAGRFQHPHGALSQVAGAASQGGAS